MRGEALHENGKDQKRLTKAFSVFLREDIHQKIRIFCGADPSTTPLPRQCLSFLIPSLLQLSTGSRRHERESSFFSVHQGPVSSEWNTYSTTSYCDSMLRIHFKIQTWHYAVWPYTVQFFARHTLAVVECDDAVMTPTTHATCDWLSRARLGPIEKDERPEAVSSWLPTPFDARGCHGNQRMSVWNATEWVSSRCSLSSWRRIRGTVALMERLVDLNQKGS